MTPRRLLTVLSLAAVPVLAGCVGDTDPATHVRSDRAQLNAHGRTNNGPAKWWWEYGTRRTTVANGGGTKTTILGPASSASDVSVNTVVKNLKPGQHYFFRGCGQDTAAGSPATCGSVREFVTSDADSVIYPTTSNGNPVTEFDGSRLVRHDVVITGAASSSFTVTDLIDASQDDPPLGSTIVTGAGCTIVPSGVSPVDAVNTSGDVAANCNPGGNSVTLALGPFDDTAVNDSGGGSVMFGDDGTDVLTGGAASDYIDAGYGDDTLLGGGGPDDLRGWYGNDYLDGGPGTDFPDCGPGSNDTAIVDTIPELQFAAANGCENISYQP